jgi:hypothetical protein
VNYVPFFSGANMLGASGLAVDIAASMVTAPVEIGLGIATSTITE